MKVLKKAKIVNISLNSPKDFPSPTIHLPNELPPDTPHSASFKNQQILHDCYEAIKTIAAQKVKALAQQQKNTMKTTADGFLQHKKTDKESEIKIPLTIAASLELILKQFIKVKAEEEQQFCGNNSPKAKMLGGKKNSNKGFFFRKCKENTEESMGDKTEENCGNIFKSMSPNAMKSDKLQAKIRELQLQLLYYKQKLAEQTTQIAKLESRELLLRKRFHDEVNKIIRAKNIVNIQACYEKDVESRCEGKSLLNVNGKRLASGGKSRIKDEEASKRSSQSLAGEELDFKETLIVKKKQTSKKDPKFKPYASAGNMFGSYLINNLKTLKAVAKDLKDQDHENGTVPKTQQLKNSLNSQAGEVQETKGVEILEEGLEGLRDEDFEAMEMDGFYDKPESKTIVYD